MANPDQLVTWVVDTTGAGHRVKPFADAVQTTQSWLELWSGYVRSSIPGPVTFDVTISAENRPTPPVVRLTEDDRLHVRIGIPPAVLSGPPGLLRRSLLDQALAGLVHCARVAANQPRTAVLSQQVHVPDDVEPDLIAGELQSLQDHEVLVIMRIDDEGEAGFDRYSEIDDGLNEIVTALGVSGLADTFSVGKTKNWIISLEPQ